MQAVIDRLVRKEDGLILLLAPPFDEGRWTRVTSRDIRQEFARMAPSTPTLPLGSCRRRPCSAREPCLRSLPEPQPDSPHERPRGVDSYRVEPYVVAGDVYSLPPHVGRGGWTWYTGAAGWLYRVGLESIVGIHRSGDLLPGPVYSRDWKASRSAYRFRSTTYSDRFENPLGLERGVTGVVARRRASSCAYDSPRRRPPILTRFACSWGNV